MCECGASYGGCVMLWAKVVYTLYLSLAAGFIFAGEDPLTLHATQDTTLNPTLTGLPPKHITTAEDLMIYGPKHSNPNYRSLVQFDLKDVPKAPVQMALLRLTFYKCWAAGKGRTDILRVHRLVRPWEESGASWNYSMTNDEWINVGGDFDPAPVAGSYVLEDQTGEDAGKKADFDVTPLVQLWQTGRAPNYGLILLNTDNDSTLTARPFSKDAKEAGKRPQLILYWASPPKPDGNMIKPTVLKPFGQPVQMRVAFNTTQLNQARIGVNYKELLKAKGGLAPYTFKCTNEMPEGMTLNPSGLLEGAPKKAGRFTLQISATDSAKHSASGKVDLVVAEAPAEGAAKTGEKKDPKKTGALADE